MKRVVLHPTALADWFGEDDPTGLRRIERAGAEVSRLGFTRIDPPSSQIVAWLVRGLPAPAASYAALASWLDVPIAVSDKELRKALRMLPQA